MKVFDKKTMKVFDCALMVTTVLMLTLAETAYFQGKYLLAIFIIVKGIYLTTVFAWLEARGDNFE